MPMANILFRGAYDQQRDEVEPGAPSVLPPMADSLPRNRLGLAQWLVDPANPLTARVTVNRFWQEIFGTGLVKTRGGFRHAGRAAVASRTARLAGGRIPRIGLGREEALSG